jgi:hypothetical protein
VSGGGIGYQVSSIRRRMQSVRKNPGIRDFNSSIVNRKFRSVILSEVHLAERRTYAFLRVL